MLETDLPICQVAEADEEQHSFLYLLLVALLIVGFLIGLLLRHFHSKYLHESTVFIFLGGVTGLIALFYRAQRLETAISFDSNLFFLVLLPPIIFESGYNMNKRVFFANFTSIFCFAIFGTLISTVTVAAGLYGVSLFGIFRYELTPMECVCFGALISATDPVTVLAIFKELKVDANLYSMVFGESVLNDAIAIVLYTTAARFIDKPLSTSAVLLGVTEFFLISIGSVAVGIIVGLLCAVLFKYSALHEQKTFEFILLLLYAYSSYLLAEGLGLSGIVSILFCGITMAHYTRRNLSQETKMFSIHFFEIIAAMAETFVFLYLGLSIFYALGDYDFMLIMFAIIFCLLGRALNVFPTAALMNLRTNRASSRRKRRIPSSHQVMMWFSGLRGAMAFALALDFKDRTQHGPVFLTTTLIIVLCTVVLLGGLTTKALELLKIKMGDSETESNSPYVQSWWQRFDKKYTKPIFTSSREYIQEISPTIDIEGENSQIPAAESTEIELDEIIDEVIDVDISLENTEEHEKASTEEIEAAAAITSNSDSDSENNSQEDK